MHHLLPPPRYPTRLGGVKVFSSRPQRGFGRRVAVGAWWSGVGLAGVIRIVICWLLVARSRSSTRGLVGGCAYGACLTLPRSRLIGWTWSGSAAGSAVGPPCFGVAGATVSRATIPSPSAFGAPGRPEGAGLRPAVRQDRAAPPRARRGPADRTDQREGRAGRPNAPALGMGASGGEGGLGGCDRVYLPPPLPIGVYRVRSGGGERLRV